MLHRVAVFVHHASRDDRARRHFHLVVRDVLGLDRQHANGERYRRRGPDLNESGALRNYQVERRGEVLHGKVPGHIAGGPIDRLDPAGVVGEIGADHPHVDAAQGLPGGVVQYHAFDAGLLGRERRCEPKEDQKSRSHFTANIAQKVEGCVRPTNPASGAACPRRARSGAILHRARRTLAARTGCAAERDKLTRQQRPEGFGAGGWRARRQWAKATPNTLNPHKDPQVRPAGQSCVRFRTEVLSSGSPKEALWERTSTTAV